MRYIKVEIVEIVGGKETSVSYKLIRKSAYEHTLLHHNESVLEEMAQELIEEEK